MQTLSKKGVLFLTAGFHQLYTFQNITHLIEHQSNHNKLPCLKIILSDGEIYISGIYFLKSQIQIEKCQRLKQFDIIRVYATYEGSTKPILISSLQILSQNHKGVYGKAPISIIDYLSTKMARQLNQNTQFQIDKSFEKQKSSFVQQRDNQKKNNQLTQIIEITENNEIQHIKRNERIEIEEENMQNNPHKKYKPNQQSQQESGQLIYQIKKRNIELQQTFDRCPSLQNDPQSVNNKSNDKKETEQQLQVTKNISQSKIIEIDVIDLDDMSTQKEKITLFPQSRKIELRKTQLKMLESIFESQQKLKQIQEKNVSSSQKQDSLTIPRSQNFQQQHHHTTPSKQLILDKQMSPYPIGTTTEKKKIRQQYNLLISNLYESNESFKIICRVNYMYEWRSKNDVPCLALDLMDSQGDQIKAIIYMNHSTKDCKECASMIEVGKVYCFQNGQCRRDYLQKQALQLVFNLKSKAFQCKQIICGGKTKIIPTKIKIQPLLQNRVQSISKIIEFFESGKNCFSNVYGVLQSFKISQYQSKTKDPIIQQEDENSPQIQIIQTQMPTQLTDQLSTQLTTQNLTQQKSIKKNSITTKSQQSYSKIYLSGFLADPLEKNKIFFTLVIARPNNNKNESAKDFLQKNLIKKGSLVVLHNVKISGNNNNTVHKLEKTKRTYFQIISNELSQWKYDKQNFGAEIVYLTQNNQNQALYHQFNQILSLTLNQLQNIYQHPKFINYSQQPYTIRAILQMNQLIDTSILPDQSCYTELKDVKIHSILQKPSVQICYYCKKKVKSPQKNTNIPNNSIKHCSRCKKIVKIITMHVFDIVFADNTASFAVEVLKDEFIETILGIKIQEFLQMNEIDRQDHLQLIKYTDFTLKIRSQNKIGGVIHKINTIQAHPIKAKIDQIKNQRKGVQQHYKRLEGSW